MSASRFSETRITQREVITATSFKKQGMRVAGSIKRDLMTIAFKTSHLTKRIMLNVVSANYYPDLGSIWSLYLRPSQEFRWYSIFSSKYIENNIPWYYSQEYRDEVSSGICNTGCVDRRIQPSGLIYHALHPQEQFASSNSRYLTTEARSDPKVGAEYRKHQDYCDARCNSTVEHLKDENLFYVTTELVATSKSRSSQVPGSQSFYLHHTKNPTMVVFLPISPAWTLHIVKLLRDN